MTRRIGPRGIRCRDGRKPEPKRHGLPGVARWGSGADPRRRRHRPARAGLHRGHRQLSFRRSARGHDRRCDLRVQAWRGGPRGATRPRCAGRDRIDAPRRMPHLGGHLPWAQHRGMRARRPARGFLRCRQALDPQMQVQLPRCPVRPTRARPQCPSRRRARRTRPPPSQHDWHPRPPPPGLRNAAARKRPRRPARPQSKPRCRAAHVAFLSP